jgi:hypothetical protein
MKVVGAYLLACVGGWFVDAVCLYFIRWLVLKRGPFIDGSVIIVGVTERAVALTLVLFAPPYLASFIGGWVLLKFAIGWQREKHSDEVAKGSFVALIGNVISFAIAIAIGVVLNPDALKFFQTAR